MPNNNTRICCVIGHPIKHSLSPIMHNAAFRKLGLNYTYLSLPVKPEDLKSAMHSLKLLNIRGVNVTIPHKTEVLKYLDSVDPLAGQIGAVNTIVNNNTKLTGYNTDGIGAINSLVHCGIKIKGKSVILLGAGGSARAISFSLLKEGISSLTILNRTYQSAVSLANDLNNVYPENALVTSKLDLKALQKYLPQSDICINTTSIGMLPHTNASPIPRRLLFHDLTVFDIVYNPLMTKLLKEAKSKGCKIVTGDLMLAYQGAHAFKLFTGKTAPTQTMLNTIRRKLR